MKRINEYKKNKEYYEKSKIVGRNIKNIRKQKRLTEMQLGKKIGKSRKFISLIEYPRYGKEIYLDSLFDISRALDVDIYYFFIGIE
jgi:transcriptional regulator with XRE-family HTH domain